MTYMSDLYKVFFEKSNKIPTLPMKCYFCQDKIDLNSVGKSATWRLDCLSCLNINKEVKCALTFFKRNDNNEMIISESRLYFHLSGSPNTYYWQFRPTDNTTTLFSITYDRGTLNVYTFNSIMNIDLDNFQQKARMCLTFS